MKMVGTFVNRGTLAAGVVTLALVAGAVGLATPTTGNCRSAATTTAVPDGHVRAKVRPAYATRADASTMDTRAKSRPVSATSSRLLSATADTQPRRKNRPAPTAAANGVLPAGAPYACA